MSNYHRLLVQGGTYFFTVVTYKRQPLLCEEHALSLLKAAFRYVMKTHPYRMDGLVILPDHLHCVWTLPENDSNSRRALKVSEQGVSSRGQSLTFESHGWLSRAPGWLHACLRKAFRPIPLLAQSFFGGNGCVNL